MTKHQLVIDNNNLGQFFLLVEEGTITLGNSRNPAETLIQNLRISRVRCILEVEGDQVAVNSQESDGGPADHRELEPGAVIRAGDCALSLEACPEEPSEQEVGSSVEETAERGAATGTAYAGLTLREQRNGGLVTEEAEPEQSLALAEEDQVKLVLDDFAGGEELEPMPVGLGEDFEETLAADVPEEVREVHAAREQLVRLTGQAFGHFRLSRLIGRGRCGVVFHALDVKDVKNTQLVALKVLAPQFPEGDQELARFVRAIKGMLPLRHPNLATLYTAGKTGSYMWISREYVEGESVTELLRRLRTSKRPDWRWGLRAAIHVARALDYARDRHFRHGKIAPSNLIVQQSDGAIRLIDLMLTSALEGSRLLAAVAAGQRANELAYLAPEQAQPGAFVDEVSDLYSLGAVTYALLTGRPPFVGDSTAEVLAQVRHGGRVEHPRVFNFTIPPPLEKVVLKLLARQAENRYQTPGQLLDDLEPIAQAQEVAV